MSDPIDHRANAERALSTIDASDDPRNLPAGLDAIGSALVALHDLLDERLPEPKPAVTMRLQGGVFPAIISKPDLPGEPVEPGDLRAGDKVEYGYGGLRYAGTLVSEDSILYSDTPCVGAYLPAVVVGGDKWGDGIAAARLLERAPREDEHDPDEALAEALRKAYSTGDWLDVARVARERIEAEQEDAVSFLREEVESLTARAKKAETEREEWREIAARYEDGRDKWQAKWRESDEARERAEAERDALRERLDALRADLSPGGLIWSVDAALRRDDERAAKGADQR